MVRSKRVFVCFGLLLSLGLAGCVAGKGSLGGGGTLGGGGGANGVIVTPSTATVDGSVDASHQNGISLTAMVLNDTGTSGVTWKTSAGTLSNTTSTSATLATPAPSATVQTITVTATAVSDSTKTGTAVITVPAALAIASLTSGQQAVAVGTVYSATLTATGGISPYKNWVLASGSGSLPPCLVLSSAGVLSSPSTPTASCAGVYSGIKFSASDSGTPNALTATSAAQTITVTAPVITFGSAPATTAFVNVAYSSAVTASGGAGTITFAKASGNLPPGVTLASNGTISGTPTSASVGNWTFTVTATDAFGDTATSSTYAIAVSYPPLTITTTSLPAGYGNTVYSQALLASGGSGTGYSWTVTSGAASLAGLNLSLSSGGVLSGTAPLAGGSASFTVQVTDSNSNTATANLTLTIKPGLSITTGTPLPTGYGGTAYSQIFAATGGSGTGLTWSVTSGASSLSALNLTLSSAGVLSGTPPAGGGSATFTVKVTDSAGNTSTATFSLTINAGVGVSAPVLAPAYPGVAYSSAAFTATGGNGGPYTWSIAAAGGSSVPAGFVINSGTGVISAASPVNAGNTSVSYNVVITATDSLGNHGSANATITIEAAVSISTGTTLPSGTVGVSYSQSLTAAGGSGGYTWQLTGASDAANLAALGLTFNAAGVLSGASPTSGNATFTATATDSQGHVSSPITFSISVNIALKINQTSLPAGNVGVSYSQTLTASGGTGTGYTFTDTTATLVGYGLSMATGGAITGTPTQAGTASFTAKVVDSGNNTATQNLSIQIYNALQLTNGNPSNGYTNAAYSGSISGSGGSGSVTLTITSALSPANGTLAANLSGNTVNLTGTPTTPATESFTVKLTDNTTGQFITRTYTFSVISATAPTITPSTLPVATVGQSYSQTITASGGIGPYYTWFANSTQVNSPYLALSNGLIVSTTGDNQLLISGTPTNSSTVPFTLYVQDNTTGLISTTLNYSVTVNTPGSQVQGSVSLVNYCGSLGITLPTMTLTINTTSPQQVQTDSSGNYSFSSVPNGTYTVTPSYSGPSGSTAVFYPASASVTVNNAAGTVPTFMVSLGYTVSGTISYSGSHTGQIYVDLVNQNCTGQGGSGTSISSAGTYTIRGVAPGSYTVNAWMDATDLGLGQGILNMSDPGGTTPVSVTTNNVTAANVTLTNNDPTSAPTSAPTVSAIFGAHNGVVIAYKPARNGNQIEVATSYDVAWSTSATLSGGALASISGSQRFNANGKGTVWILNNAVTGTSSFADGTTYYFMVRSNNSFGHGVWSVYGGGTPTGVTVNPPSGSYTISGNVTVPSGVTVGSSANLYVGVYSSTDGIYATTVSSPAVGSNNPFTLNVPNTSTNTWQMFAILDQNNNGQIDTGDLSNTRSQNGPPTVTITGSGTQNVSLSNASMVTAVQTRYKSITSLVGSYTDYSFVIGGAAAAKLPVSMTLTAASNPNVIVPMDISSYCTDCGAAEFQTSQDIHGDTPAVGDTYTFTVNYSDGTSDTNVTAAVTGWNGTGAVVGPSALATNLLPNGTTGPGAGTRTQPTFSWTYPSGASTAGDYYVFTLCCNLNADIWDVPSTSSNASGFLYSQVPGASLTWNVDPTGSGSTTGVSNLTTGVVYSWSVTASDSNQNQATAGTWYQP